MVKNTEFDSKNCLKETLFLKYLFNAHLLQTKITINLIQEIITTNTFLVRLEFIHN
jgi:hypothetical protein